LFASGHCNGEVIIWGLTEGKLIPNAMFKPVMPSHDDEKNKMAEVLSKMCQPVSRLWCSLIGRVAVRYVGGLVIIFEYQSNPHRLGIESIIPSLVSSSSVLVCSWNDLIDGGGTIVVGDGKELRFLAARSDRHSFEVGWREFSRVLIPSAGDITSVCWHSSGSVIVSAGTELFFVSKWKVLDESAQSLASQQSDGKIAQIDWSEVPGVAPPLISGVMNSRPALPPYHPKILAAFLRSGERAKISLICQRLASFLKNRADESEKNEKNEKNLNNLGVTSLHNEFYISPKLLMKESNALEALKLAAAENEKNKKSKRTTISTGTGTGTGSTAEEDKSGISGEEYETSGAESSEEAEGDSLYSDLEDELEKTKQSSKVEDKIMAASVLQLQSVMTTVQLPHLDGLEQMQVAAILDTFAKLQNFSDGSVDVCGLRFLVAQRLHSYLRKALPPSLKPERISSADLAWALHSEAQSTILNECLSPDSCWEDAREIGVGYWVINRTLLTNLVEQLGKAHFSKQKNPSDCAIFYLMLGKKATLAGLYKAVKDSRLSAFLSNDFSSEKWRIAAAKSAFTLHSQHRFSLCAAFFILANQPSDAIQVILSKMNDPQLALLVARCMNPTLEENLIKESILPMAKKRGDLVLASICHWLVRDYPSSLSALMDPDVQTITFDPSTLHYYRFLRAHPLLRLDPTLQTYSADERSLARKSVSSYFRSGCHVVALSIIQELSLLSPPSIITATDSKKTSGGDDDKERTPSNETQPEQQGDDWDFGASETPKRPVNDWDFDSVETKKPVDDWDFGTTETKKPKEDWMTDDQEISYDGEEENDETKEASLNGEENSKKEEKIEKIEISTEGEDHWVRMVLLHCCEMSAEAGIAQLLRGADLFEGGKLSTIGSSAQNLLDLVISDELPFWCKEMKIPESLLLKRIERLLKIHGYILSCYKFTHEMNPSFSAPIVLEAISTLVDCSLHLPSYLPFSFFTIEDAVRLELEARRLSPMLPALSSTLNDHITFFSFISLFLASFLRADGEALKLLLYDNDINFAVSKLSSYSSDRLLNAFSQPSSFDSSLDPDQIEQSDHDQENPDLIRSYALKLLSIKLSLFINKENSNFSSNEPLRLAAREMIQWAIAHPSHRAKKSNPGTFAKFASANCSDALLASAGWPIHSKSSSSSVSSNLLSSSGSLSAIDSISTSSSSISSSTSSSVTNASNSVSSTSSSSSRWVEVPDQKEVPISHRESITSFCFDKEGKVGAYSSHGSVREFPMDFNLDLSSTKKIRSGFFSSDIEHVFTRELRKDPHKKGIGAGLNAKNSTMSQHVGVGCDWVEQLPDTSYYMGCCGENLKLFKFYRNSDVPLSTLTTESRSTIERCSFNPSGTVIAAAIHDGHIELWSTSHFATSTSKTFYKQKAHEKKVNDLIFLNEGNIVATAGSAKHQYPTVCLFDTLEPPTRPAASIVVGSSATSLRCTPDKRYLIVGDKDGSLNVLDVRKFSVSQTVKKAHLSTITSMSLAGGTVVTGSSDCSVKLWSLKDFSLIKTWDNEHGQRPLIISDSIGTTKVNSFLCDNSLVVVSSGHDGSIIKRVLVQEQV